MVLLLMETVDPLKGKSAGCFDNKWGELLYTYILRILRLGIPVLCGQNLIESDEEDTVPYSAFTNGYL